MNTGRTQTSMSLPFPCFRESGEVGYDGHYTFKCEDNGTEKYGDGG